MCSGPRDGGQAKGRGRRDVESLGLKIKGFGQGPRLELGTHQWCYKPIKWPFIRGLETGNGARRTTALHVCGCFMTYTVGVM